MLSVPEWMDRDVEIRVFLLSVDVPGLHGPKCRVLSVPILHPRVDGPKCRVLGVSILSLRVDGPECHVRNVLYCRPKYRVLSVYSSIVDRLNRNVEF